MPFASSVSARRVLVRARCSRKRAVPAEDAERARGLFEAELGPGDEQQDLAVAAGQVGQRSGQP